MHMHTMHIMHSTLVRAVLAISLVSSIIYYYYYSSGIIIINYDNGWLGTRVGIYPSRTYYTLVHDYCTYHVHFLIY